MALRQHRPRKVLSEQRRLKLIKLAVLSWRPMRAVECPRCPRFRPVLSIPHTFEEIRQRRCPPLREFERYRLCRPIPLLHGTKGRRRSVLLALMLLFILLLLLLSTTPLSFMRTSELDEPPPLCSFARYARFPFWFPLHAVSQKKNAKGKTAIYTAFTTLRRKKDKRRWSDLFLLLR